MLAVLFAIHHEHAAVDSAVAAETLGCGGEHFTITEDRIIGSEVEDGNMRPLRIKTTEPWEPDWTLIAQELVHDSGMNRPRLSQPMKCRIGILGIAAEASS